MKKLKNNIILLLILLLGLSTHNINAQCVIGNFSKPDCIEVNIPVTFLNASTDYNTCNWNSTEYYWDVIDSSGASIYAGAGTPSQHLLNFPFPYSGTFTVELFPSVPGNAWTQNNCCPGGWGNIWTSPETKTIIVLDSTLSINSNDSIEICSGGGGGTIDTASLNLEINNNVGPVDFVWTAIPSGMVFNTVNPMGIDPNDTEIQLTVIDLTTGCEAYKTIVVSVKNTNIDASFTVYNLDSIINSSGCATDSLVFVANDSTKASISWIINNNQLIGDTSSITTSLSQYLSGSSSVNIALTILDTIAGCYVSSDSDFVFSFPPFIVLDTSQNDPTMPTFYDTIRHGFDGCNNTGSVTLTFNNSNLTIGNGNQNIDSLVFLWPDADTTTMIGVGLDAFLFYGQSVAHNFVLNDSNVVFTVIAINSAGCSYSTSYTVLAPGDQQYTVNSFGISYIGATLCSDTLSTFYLTSPVTNSSGTQIANYPITQIPINDKVVWTIFCEFNQIPPIPIDTITWTSANFVPDSAILLSGDSAIVLQYKFPSNSCNCLNINGDQAYSVYASYEKFCDPGSVIGASQTVKIEDPPTAKFDANTPICEDQTVIFTNNTEVGCDGSTLNQQLDSVLFFQWDFGDCDSEITFGTYPFPGTQHQYALPGEYWAKLTVDAACGISYDSALVVINPLPNVSFDADPVCLGQKTLFNNNSSTESADTRIDSCYSPPRVINVPAGGNIVSWEWMIDPNISTSAQQYAWDALGDFKSINGGPFDSITDLNDEEIAFQFDNCGTYTVWLRAIDVNGCDSMYSFDVIVYDLPEPTFSTDEVCQGNCTPIIDSSYAQTNPCTGNPLALWEYEIYNAMPAPNDTIMDSISFDASISADTCYEFFPPCDLFSSTMSYDYNIWLTVTDSFGCIDSIMETTTILCQPIAEFDSSDICLGDTKFFENKSSPILGMDWKWEIDTTLGDYVNGTTDSSESPYFLFDTCGTFVVKQILKSDNCNDTIEHSITVFCLPQPSLFADPECEGDTMQVISTSQPGDYPSAEIDSWIWDFTSINDSTVQFVFPSCDSIDVTLTVEDINGCQQDTTQKIFVFCNPTALFNVDNECFDDEQQPIEFNDASTYVTAPINYWEWTINGLGDYVSPYDSSWQFTQYQFNICGPQFFSLKVRDSNGCEDIKPGTVMVYCEPTADFNADPVCF